MSSLDKYEQPITKTTDSMISKVIMYLTPSAIILLTSILLSS